MQSTSGIDSDWDWDAHKHARFLDALLGDFFFIRVCVMTFEILDRASGHLTVRLGRAMV